MLAPDKMPMADGKKMENIWKKPLLSPLQFGIRFSTKMSPVEKASRESGMLSCVCFYLLFSCLALSTACLRLLESLSYSIFLSNKPIHVRMMHEPRFVTVSPKHHKTG